MRLKKLLLLAVISASIFAVTSCVSNKKKNNATSTIPSSSVITTQPSTIPSTTPSTTPSVVPSTPSTAPSVVPSTPSTAPSVVPSTPSTPSEPEYKENGTNIGSIENGTGKVLTEGQIEVLSCSGLIEAGYVVYNKVDAANSYNIYVKGNKYQEFTLVDKKIAYTKEVSETQIRTDLLGLSSGTYQIKLVPVVAGAESNATATVVELGVKAYDRSGYAHFNYTAGIGAYNDDGTLKDNAIVIYVTDENKDYVMSEICEEYNINMFNIPNEMTNNWNNKEAKGIGWWLNNAQYTKATKDSNGNVNASKTSNTYSSQGQSLGFYSVTENHPIAIRFVGTVTTPEGCTAYDSYGEGGSPGDNGHMARMKDLNNVTLEGVGVDAKIEGWGFHFMASDTTNVRGKSFEARNLTFDKYPEDALGMEGTQEDSTKTIKASVERCWVHHCTFLPGYCANPAESDKSEGDGSCDFKRGQYFTMSYCYYEYCHKTNLIGSSDSSLQYNISFHHNYWYNCGSRIPLLRQANIHFYNNYVYGDINDDTADLSYVTSLRGNAYMYSENNYYEGCKQVFETGNSGAVAKVFGNTYIGCFKTNFVECSVTDAQTRDEKIDVCNCAYKDISYKNFDTNPDLFYYDVEKQQSDCYLTTSTVAREECIKFAGSYYRTILNKTASSILNTKSNQYTPTAAIDMSSGSFTATLPTTKDNQVINNIMYNNINSVSSGLVKFRGQGVTFMVDTYVTVNAVMTGSKSDAMYSGNIVKSNGQVMLNGSGSAVLSPGIYYIVSCQMDGDTSLTSLTFEKYNSEEVKAEAIANYNAAYNNIPADITYTNDCYLKIQSAIDAYTSLGEWKSDVLTTPYAAYNEYMALGVSYVEGLISTIGTVNVDSGLAILAAREAYDSLIQKCPAAEVSNYTTLTAAEEAFKNFAVLSCINKIDTIGTVTLESKDLIALARTEYDLLDDELKAQVTNYQVLLDAELKYKSLVSIDNVEKLIAAASDANSIKEAVDAYNDLTEAEKLLVSNSDKIYDLEIQNVINLIDIIPDTITSAHKEIIDVAFLAYNSLGNEQKSMITNYEKLKSAQEQLETLLNAMHTMSFENGISNDYFTISGNTSSSKGSATYQGETYNTCLKIESSTNISFEALIEVKLTLVTNNAGKKIKIDGIAYVIDTDGILTITLSSGSHTITKGDVANLFYIIVE